VDISQLKHDPTYIARYLEATDDKQIITKQGCKLYIPARYVDKNLALIGNDIYILGVYGLVMQGRWAFSSSACMIKIEPLGQNKVQIGDYEYIEFEFLPGSTLIANTDVVREDTLLYSLFDYFVDGGRIPWYLPYEEYGTLFDNAAYFTGVRLGAHPAIMQMIISTTARNPADRVQYYRQILKSAEDLKQPPVYVPYKSVLYGPKTTTSRLMGAYFDAGLVSALNNPTERTERIETLLRS
jgi:hypothetical protein